MASALAADPSIREVEHPELEDSLREFTCGGGKPYEQEVDEIVHAFHQGRVVVDFLTFTIAEFEADLVGCCASHYRPLPPLAIDAIYLAVIGINQPFRGRRLPDGSRIGDFLLRDMLERIEQKWIEMPRVWALIDQSNLPSRDLFDRHDFSELPQGPSAKNALYFRPAGLPLP